MKVSVIMYRVPGEFVCHS